MEEANGTINGVNKDFSTPTPYQPGSLFVFWNGQLLPLDDDDGHDEIDPGTGAFRTRVAPVGGESQDKVWARYIET